MDADWIITAFVLIDTVLDQFDHRSHALAQVPDSEIVLVAVIAAKHFQGYCWQTHQGHREQRSRGATPWVGMS
jgi:hypothetical protein